MVAFLWDSIPEEKCVFLEKSCLFLFLSKDMMGANGGFKRLIDSLFLFPHHPASSFSTLIAVSANCSATWLHVSRL